VIDIARGRELRLLRELAIGICAALSARDLEHASEMLSP